MSPEEPKHTPAKLVGEPKPVRRAQGIAPPAIAGDPLDPADTRAFILDQFADGELTPEEILEIERDLASMPGAEAHITFSRELRSACVHAMADVPLDPGCRDRVRDAVRLRLRGEADALAASGLATANPSEAHKPLIFKNVRFIRLATAAALILAGFAGARFTQELSEARTFGSTPTAGIGYDMQTKALRSAYLEGAISHAESFLGAKVALPEHAYITPIRYEPGATSEDLRSVVFTYVVSYPDSGEPDGMVKVPVTLIIQQDNQANFDPGIVVEHGQGEVLWQTRQQGPLMYNIQSESVRAIEIVAHALGWPTPIRSGS